MTKKSQKSNLTATSENVLGLIEDTIARNDVLGTGNFATVYAFRDSELAPYVLRVGKLPENQSIIQSLTQRTSLTPPNNLLLNAHLGQPLLVNNPRHPNPILGIYQRVKGVSLKKLKQEYPDSNNRMKVFLDGVEKQGANPFLPLFIDAGSIAFSHYAIDKNIGNIMVNLENGSMQLIDQLGFQKENKGDTEQALRYINGVASSVKKGLFFPEPKDPQALAIHRQQFARIEGLIREAYEVVVSMVKTNPKSLEFAKINSTQAIKMDMPRASLIKTLHELNNKINQSVERS